MATHHLPTAVKCGKAKPAWPSAHSLGGLQVPLLLVQLVSTCMTLSCFLPKGLPLPHPQQALSLLD